jgi:hypothetical protein
MIPSSVIASSRSGQVVRVLVALLALVQTIRATAFQLVQDVLANREPAAWLFPAFVDIFVGVTAPFVAYALWKRRGLGVWVTAIVWFTISISDHLDALTAAYISTIPQLFPQDRVAVAVFLLFGVITEGLAILWLTRQGTRSFYLGQHKP